MSPEAMTLISSIICGLLASTGMWGFLTAITSKRSYRDKLLLGLAYERIVALGMAYIEKGYITKDEYDDLEKYLYEPYLAMDGDGAAKRIMEQVNRLEIRSTKNV